MTRPGERINEATTAQAPRPGAASSDDVPALAALRDRVPQTTRNGARRVDQAEVLLVCSSGGHLMELLALSGVWSAHKHLWVTFDRTDARTLLRGQRVVVAHHPTNRSLKNFVRNASLALGVVRLARPRLLVTTGAGVAVPFAWIAKLAGAKVVYVESLTRTDGLSLSGRLIRPIADRFYVQWPELAGRIGARHVGQIFETR